MFCSKIFEFFFRKVRCGAFLCLQDRIPKQSSYKNFEMGQLFTCFEGREEEMEIRNISHYIPSLNNPSTSPCHCSLEKPAIALIPTSTSRPCLL